MKLKPCAAAGVVALCGGSPAAAVSVVDGSCAAVSGAHGCLFLGGITAATTADTITIFNLYNDTHPGAGSDINLQFLFKSDQTGFPGLVTGKVDGTWSVPGYNIRYFAVSAGPNFTLYRLPARASGGAWSTVDIPHGKSLREVRDLVFFGAAVPEPASWAMLLAGFGLVGAKIRRRRHVEALA